MRVRVPPGLALALALAFTSYTHLSAPLPVGADEDIRLYWPKLRPGGIMAGHDYLTAAQVGLGGLTAAQVGLGGLTGAWPGLGCEALFSRCAVLGVFFSWLRARSLCHSM